MRTAVTLGVTHKGGEVLISGRAVPIHKQKEAFNALLGKPEHAELSELTYQESDGHPRHLRFNKPAAKQTKQLD